MNKSLLKNLFATIIRYRFRLILAFLMILIGNGLLVVNPLLFRQALLTLYFPSSEETNSFFPLLKEWMSVHLRSVYSWALLLLAIAILSALLKYYMRLILTTIGREVELEVRDQLFDRIQLQSQAFFDRHQIGDLISRLTNDIAAYRDVLGPGLMYPMLFLTLEIPSFIALFYLSPSMALLATVPLVLVAILQIFIRQPLFWISQQVQQSLSAMSTMAHEHYSGIKVIKSYGIEEEMQKLFTSLCRQFSFFNSRLSCLQGSLFPVLSLITKVATLSLVILSAFMIFNGWSQLTLADFLSFMWIQSYVFSPLLMLGWILPIYEKGRAAYGRLVEIYEEPIEIYTHANPIPHLPSQTEIVFNDLTFVYPNQQNPALEKIHLSIKGGAFIGITGPVGAGKSTLFRLLNREYEVPEGKILIGGQDIHAYALSAFHSEIVTVEQLPFLFSKTIKDNIRFGKQEATQDELERVAKQVDLYHTILEFPDQYETIVGERGVSLSGGQKQRVAMARAFLVNRSILLLDDIFSAIDSETERRIFNEMKVNFAGKTILLITHRISILDQLDQVIFMREGQLIEQGNPQELARQKGPYAALKELQEMHVYDSF